MDTWWYARIPNRAEAFALAFLLPLPGDRPGCGLATKAGRPLHLGDGHARRQLEADPAGNPW